MNFFRPTIEYLLICIVFVVIGCKQYSKSKYIEYEFAIENNKPVFEDDYLYEKSVVKCLVEKANGIDVFYCDWNGNNAYKELGIDYVGIKSRLEYKPKLTLLDSINYIKINGQNHQLITTGHESRMISTHNTKEPELNLITHFTPLLLDNGNVFTPKFSKDSTVIYFWATWCRPCVETLKNIDLKKLEDNGIDFIPIAYDCSDSGIFLKDNNLDFQDLFISEKSAQDYNIKSLSKQFTILRNQELSDRNVNLKKYFSNKH